MNAKRIFNWGRLPKVQVGAPPGTLRGDPQASPPKLTVIAYGPDDVVEAELDSVEQINDYLGKWPVTWVNVDGVAHAETIGRLGKLLNIHHLVIEDVVNVPQRAKVDTFDDHCFIVTRMATLGERLRTEQLSLAVGNGFVVSFQETPGDCFGPIRERLRTGGGGRIRKAGPDYLAYAIIDAVVDAYFPLLEAYGERLEDLEVAVVTNPRREAIRDIHRARRELLSVRRAVWPQREMINALLRDDIPQIAEKTKPYLRDCYDHVVQIIDLTETFRELASGLLDAYMSSMSNRMNDVMKVLTIIATIFIPLSFIAGLYGMNFKWMPETEWKWSYPLAVLAMMLVAVGMLLAFWRRGWLGGGGDDDGREDDSD